MLTPKMSGLFDVREYDGKTKEHSARRMKADTDNIVFSAMFAKDQLPDCFKVGDNADIMLKERASKKERTAAEVEGRQPNLDSFVASFKIGANAKWFNKYGKPCDRPTNAELEEGRWNVQIDFARKEKDEANPLKPSGYWVNAIMLAKIEENPFEGQAFEAEDDKGTTNAAEDKDEGEADLPF